MAGIAALEKSLAKWAPPAWGRRMAETFFTHDSGTTLRKRCEAAGITMETWWGALQDERFVEWFNGNCERFIRGHLGAMGLELLKRAMDGDKTADVKLFLERWDPSYTPTQKVAVSVQPPPLVLVSEVKAGDKGLLRRLHDKQAKERAARAVVDAEVVPQAGV